MKPLLITTLLLLSATASMPARAEDKTAAPPLAAPAPKNPESIDISGLEENYWRPNKDELEVVQNRRFEKAHKWELAVQYGIFQGQDYVDSKSIGGSLTYNFTNQFFTEFSYFKINNSDNDFLNSVRTRFAFTPDFNRENHQMVLMGGWTPIYAKFALLGRQISHFEMYLAPGVGITNTTADHLSGHLTIGQKFFITEHLLLRLEWRITKFTDTINTTQGSTSKANGGSGYVDQAQTTNNIIFGLGVMY